MDRAEFAQGCKIFLELFSLCFCTELGVLERIQYSMKRFLLNGVIYAIGLLIVLELFFKFILPAADWPRGVILDSSIRRFDSESFSAGNFSYGRYCKGRFAWSINDSGWNSIYVYEEAHIRNLPMVAILGDSYIEGFYSDVDEHIDVFLTELFEDSVQFYTFAMSGGILSQYIALMKYEVEQFSPDAYIVFVNSLDVIKSIRELGGRHPYYFQYSVDSLGICTEVIPFAESRSKYKDIILRSAFVRYLRANAQISLLGGGLADENTNQIESEMLGPVEIDSDLKNAAEFLLCELNSFNRPVLIVADCPKSWIYDTGAEEAFDDVIALRESVDSYPNVHLIELAPYFQAEYAEQGLHFSVSGNPHWDSNTNRFVSRVLSREIDAILLSTRTRQ